MMKRQYDEDYDGGADGEGGGKRSKGGDPTIRILIQSKAAGGVIGRGGENIKRIRGQYPASISVPDSNTPERVLTISNTSKEDAVEIVRDLLPKINGERESEAPPHGQLDLRLLIHQSHAGAVIGRQGFKIKELREQTGAQLKVYGGRCPFSEERIVQITGERDKVVDCMRAILVMIDELPLKGPLRPYDTINYDPAQVHEYGGFPPDRNWKGGMGGGASRGPPLPPRGGLGGDRFGEAPQRFDDWGMGRARGGGGGFGGRSGVVVARGGDDWGRGGHQIRGGGVIGGVRGPMGAGGDASFMMPPMPAAPAMHGGPTETTQVTIPSELGGTIIGKNGERINRIREESGAQINIDPPNKTNPQDERVITITGTGAQIQMAQYLLQQCVRSSAAGRKYIEQQQGR